MFKVLKKFGLSALFLMVFLAMTVSASAARLFLEPASADLFANCNVAVNIMIDSEGEQSSASDAHIFFNPAEIDIVEVREGNAYDIYPGNRVVGGKISLTGANLDITSPYETVGSPDVYGTLIIKNKPGVFATSMNFDFTLGDTVDSNVSDVTGVIDYLTSVGNGSYTFTDHGYCGNDLIPPQVDNEDPAPGTRGHDLDSNIEFDITDNNSGVDISTVVVTVDGVEYRDGDAGFSYTGTKADYHIVINPSSDFILDTPVFVKIEASDLAIVPNVMPPHEYSFNHPIPDNDPPYVQNTNPGPGDTNVPLDSNISLHVLDDISGVDITTIVVTIDGTSYRNGDPGVTIGGSPGDYFITIDPSVDFVVDTPVFVTVEATDLKGNAMVPYNYSFNHPLADNQPPYVNNPLPTPGNRTVPLDANISFYLRDNVSGVDLTTVVVNINGVEYKEADFMTLTGDKNDYFIEIDPSVDFPEGVEITVTVDAIDQRGNVMPTYTYKFNRPAVCGDNVVETAFGEDCEPPGNPGCGADCKLEICQLPTVAVCGNMFVEVGEECEPPNSLVCDSNCLIISEEDEAKMQFLNYAGFIGLDNEEQRAFEIMIDDRDGDGLPDIVERAHGLNLDSADSDGDGYSDLDELLNFGTDPNEFDEDIDFSTRITSPGDGAVTGAGRLFVRGVSFPGLDVNVTATSLEGVEYDLGNVLASDEGYFALSSKIELTPGEYLLRARSYEVDDSLKTTSKAVEILIDPASFIKAPLIRSINDIIVKPGVLPEVADPQPMIAGVTEPRAQLIAVFESSIFTSTILSDSLTGFFTVFAPRPLELGEHKVTVYAISDEGVISDAAVLDFRVIEKESILKSFPWWWILILIIFLIFLLIALYYWYKKRKKEKELKRMEKLQSSLLEGKTLTQEELQELRESEAKHGVTTEMKKEMGADSAPAPAPENKAATAAPPVPPAPENKPNDPPPPGTTGGIQP